eukprot:15255575-Alexandrium_andersonii.AAC.1
MTLGSSTGGVCGFRLRPQCLILQRVARGVLMAADGDVSSRRGSSCSGVVSARLVGDYDDRLYAL